MFVAAVEETTAQLVLTKTAEAVGITAAETEDCLGRQFGECLHRLHQDLEMKIITNFTEDQRNIMKNGQNMSLEQERIDLQVQDHHGCKVQHLHHQDVNKQNLKSITTTEGPDGPSKIL